MYKIFIGDNVISFPTDISQCTGAIIIDPTDDIIDGLIRDCLCKGNAKISLFSQQREDLIEIFNKKFVHIPAAGGIVRHADTGKVLFIHRGEMWDLPKGWLEAGETSEIGAVREVMEETGLAHLELKGYVYTSSHAYVLKGQLMLKDTHWYAMSTTDEQLTPQIEEGIDTARWFSMEEVQQALSHTYASIRETFSHYTEKYI